MRGAAILTTKQARLTAVPVLLYLRMLFLTEDMETGRSTSVYSTRDFPKTIPQQTSFR